MKYEELKEIIEKSNEGRVSFKFDDECIYSTSICFQKGYPLPKGVITYNQVKVTFQNGNKEIFPLDPMRHEACGYLDIYSLMKKLPVVHEKDLEAIYQMNKSIASTSELCTEDKDNLEHQKTIELLEKSKKDLYEKLSELSGLSEKNIQGQYLEYVREWHGD